MCAYSIRLCNWHTVKIMLNVNFAECKNVKWLKHAQNEAKICKELNGQWKVSSKLKSNRKCFERAPALFLCKNSRKGKRIQLAERNKVYMKCFIDMLWNRFWQRPRLKYCYRPIWFVLVKPYVASKGFILHTNTNTLTSSVLISADELLIVSSLFSDRLSK